MKTNPPLPPAPSSSHTPGKGATIIQFQPMQKTVDLSTLSVKQVFTQNTNAALRYPLANISDKNEIAIGKKLDRRLRSPYNHLTNLIGDAQRELLKYEAANKQFIAMATEPDGPKKAPKERIAQANALIKEWNDHLYENYERIGRERVAFHDIFLDALPEMEGDIVMIRRGYALVQLTLPFDLAWLDLIPEKDRCDVAAALEYMGKDPYALSAEEAEMMFCPQDVETSPFRIATAEETRLMRIDGGMPDNVIPISSLRRP